MNLAQTLDLQSCKVSTMFQGIPIKGFDTPEEELVRATVSRVPPELMNNVKEIVADRTLGAKHGRFVPETKTVRINPLKFDLRQRFGHGQGWIFHFELTMVHEFGHSIFDNLSDSKKQEWNNISGWVQGQPKGNLPPYVEKRPGWEIGKTSSWTHKPGVGFTRRYAERNPDEDFADSFAFFMLNKAHQMAPAKQEFIQNLIQQSVYKYPKVSIQSPDHPYGERDVHAYGTSDGARKGWDTRGRGKNWTKKSAEKFIGGLPLKETGFSAKVIGSVATRGTSDHDLDILLEPTPEAVKKDNYDFQALLDHLHKSGASSQPTYIGEKELWEVKLPTGHIVDFIFSDEEKSLEATGLVSLVQAYGTHEGLEKAWDTRGRGRKEPLSERAQRALISYVPSTRETQQLAAAAEIAVAKAIGGEALPDHEPFDVIKGKIAVEVKTMQKSGEERINMKSRSRMRKEAYARKNGMRAYTVAVDYRSGKATVYYKKGVGAFALNTMERLTNIKELRSVLK